MLNSKVANGKVHRNIYNKYKKSIINDLSITRDMINQLNTLSYPNKIILKIHKDSS